MEQYNKEYFKKRNRHLVFIKALCFSFLIKIFLKPKTLLDAGCAYGELVKIAKYFGIKAYGVDKSKHAIFYAKKNNSKCFSAADILSLPFKNESFDTVVSLALMEHIPDAKVNKALSEVIRVAKKYILLQICVEDSLLESKRHYLSDPTHVNVVSSEWWEKKFKNLGIKYQDIPRLGIFLLYK